MDSPWGDLSGMRQDEGQFSDGDFVVKPPSLSVGFAYVEQDIHKVFCTKNTPANFLVLMHFPIEKVAVLPLQRMFFLQFKGSEPSFFTI